MRKLLLDENLPHQIRLEIEGHEVLTVAFMGWSGVENSELLDRAAAERFDALITNDRGIAYGQNGAELPVAVIILRAKANHIEAIRPLYPALQRALHTLKPRTIVTLDDSAP